MSLASDTGRDAARDWLVTTTGEVIIMHPTDPTMTVGQRIRYYRERAGKTRAVLAGLVGKSEGWVKAVENGRLLPPRLSMLVRLAEVLGVSNIADLTGRQSMPLDQFVGPGHPALPAVRDAVNSFALTPDRDTPPALDHLRTRLATGWGALHASPNHRTTIGALLPDLLRDAQHATRLHGGEARRAALAVLAGSLNLTQMYLAYQPDAALVWRVTDRAMASAQESGDPLALGCARWFLLHAHRESGQWEAAQAIARQGLRELEPLLPNGSPDTLAMWGSLHLEAACTAGRSGEQGTAWHHWDQAQQAAERLPAGYHHPQTSFGPAFIGPHAVTVAVELRQGGEAQRQAARADVAAIPSRTRRGKKLVDMARGYHLNGDLAATIGTLTESHRTAPETIRYNGFARRIVLDLMDGPPSSRRAAHGLAEQVGLLN